MLRATPPGASVTLPGLDVPWTGGARRRALTSRLAPPTTTGGRATYALKVTGPSSKPGRPATPKPKPESACHVAAIIAPRVHAGGKGLPVERAAGGGLGGAGALVGLALRLQDRVGAHLLPVLARPQG